uniref:Uncharacterized protein n=1 Tax=Litorilinea aerophila TaxID=1204385 RepID=A0A540V7I7_9CHLR
MSHSEIIHKKFSTFFRKGGEGYSEGMCKKESFLCGNKVIIYNRGISHEQVCVLVARDRTKATVSKVSCMGRIVR